MSNFRADALIRSWALSDPTLEQNTLRGISRALQHILGKPEGICAEDCQRLSRVAKGFLPQAEHAAQDALRLLESLPQESPINDLYAESLDVFRQACQSVSLLIGLEGGCAEEVGSLQEALARVEGVEALLAENVRNWNSWKNSADPRCSRCGYQSQEPDHDDETCPHCEVDLLIPDARSTNSVLTEQAILGPEYVLAFKVYLQLQDGDVTLEKFEESLAPLKKLVAKWQRLLNAGALRTLEKSLQDSIASSVAESQAGLAKIAEAEVTRDWIDINNGWDLIYQAGVSVQSQLPTLYRVLGEPQAADDLEAIFRTRDLSIAYN